MILQYEQRFSYTDVQKLLDAGHAVDGKAGGLVLGPSHANGGVNFLNDFGDCYKLMGELEGYEYVFNIAAGYMTRNSFKEINDHIRDKQTPFEEYTPDVIVRTIDARLPPNSPFNSKFILFEGRGFQCIINRHSTKRLLDFIDETNRQYSYQYDSDIFRLTKTVDIIDTFEGKTIATCPILWK